MVFVSLIAHYKLLQYSDQSRKLLEQTVGFTINYEREDPYDTRELSEFPDIRLWFVRLDASYPWFPVLLDWRAGELARYAAMLVPHQVIIVIQIPKLSKIPVVFLVMIKNFLVIFKILILVKYDVFFYFFFSLLII